MPNYPEIFYPDAALSDLDAGRIITYPLADGRYSYYKVPDFLIVGAQKCGTRELHTWLSAHPEVQGQPNECHFFDEVLDIEAEWPRYIFSHANLIAKDDYQLSRRKNLQLFEKTPAYFDKSNRGVPVPGIVQKMMPSGKFIMLLRNPTYRLYSAYQMGRHVQDTIGPQAECLNYDFSDFAAACVNTDPAIDRRFLSIGRYVEHIKTWLNYFPRQQLHIIIVEQFKKDPFIVMDGLLNFLQLPAIDYRVLAEKNSKGFWVIKGQYSKANAKPYPLIPEKAKKLLDQYYQPWNQKLQTLLPGLHINWV